jgi:hypothetical protein
MPVCAGIRHIDVHAHKNKMLTNEEECQMDCCSVKAEGCLLWKKDVNL